MPPTEGTDQTGLTAAELRDHLAEERALDDARREDALARRTNAARHRISMAGVRDQLGLAWRQRRERSRDAREAARLAELHRRASVSGERAKIAAEIQQSAEVRALRVARVRHVSLWGGVPVLVAFGLWSTTGVHAGVTSLLHLPGGSPGWWAAWLVEPALIAVAGMIILGRAWLRSAGGDVDERATAAQWVALATSILLNVAGHWPEALTMTAVTSVVAHSIGPVGAAATAWIIGTFDDYVQHAKPHKGAKTLADLGITRPEAPQAPQGGLEVAPPTVPEAPAVEQPVPEPVTGDTPKATVTQLARVTDEELLTKARAVWVPGMSVTAFRQALGVGMRKAHPLHRQMREEYREATG